MKALYLTKYLTALILTALCLLTLTACGATATPTANSQSAANVAPPLASGEKPVKIQAQNSFVGKTKEEEIYVALLMDGKSLQAYTCDGTPEQAKVSEWFKGELAADNVSFILKSEAGATIEGKLATQTVNGSLKTVSGKNLNFEVVPATGNAGMYRFERGQDDTKLVYGWVVLNDGSVRGAGKEKKRGILTTPLVSFNS
jgi:hypothetical protein